MILHCYIPSRLPADAAITFHVNKTETNVLLVTYADYNEIKDKRRVYRVGTERQLQGKCGKLVPIDNTHQHSS